MRPKLVIAGGTGFLGQVLAPWFESLGWVVVILSRRPATRKRSAQVVQWDGRTPGPWQVELEGATALVNLTGRSVNCRYNQRNRRVILASRIEPTHVLGEAIEQLVHPPQVWLNASTATIYKHSFDRPMDEVTGEIRGTPLAKDMFSVDVAQAWEAAFAQANTPKTRKVALRTAMVFGTQPGTVYRVLRRLARIGLGGSMAGGQQYVSWLHELDFCRAIEWLIERDDIHGPVNLSAPRPLTNRDMMLAIRRACGVPIGLPATRWMLEVGAIFLRTETELMIKSRRVVPTRLTAAGFEFRFNDIDTAIADLELRLRRHIPLRPEQQEKSTRAGTAG